MEIPNDDLARLDMAARALISETFISRNRWLFLFINLCFVASAFAPDSRFDNPLLAPVFAVCASFATAILWVHWRYKLYVPALFCFAIAIGFVLLGKAVDMTSGRIYGSIMSAMFGYAIWTQAGPFATVNAPGWEKEQAQVSAWWRVLTAPERNEEVIEFSAGSFWTGVYAYRLMRPGPFWAVAKLYKGEARRLSDYRIRELSAVTFTGSPTGEMMVTMGNRTMRVVNISPPTLDRGQGWQEARSHPRCGTTGLPHR